MDSQWPTASPVLPYLVPVEDSSAPLEQVLLDAVGDNDNNEFFASQGGPAPTAPANASWQAWKTFTSDTQPLYWEVPDAGLTNFFVPPPQDTPGEALDSDFSNATGTGPSVTFDTNSCNWSDNMAGSSNNLMLSNMQFTPEQEDYHPNRWRYAATYTAAGIPDTTPFAPGPPTEYSDVATAGRSFNTQDDHSADLPDIAALLGVAGLHVEHTGESSVPSSSTSTWKTPSAPSCRPNKGDLGGGGPAHIRRMLGRKTVRESYSPYKLPHSTLTMHSSTFSLPLDAPFPVHSISSGVHSLAYSTTSGAPSPSSTIPSDDPSPAYSSSVPSPAISCLSASSATFATADPPGSSSSFPWAASAAHYLAAAPSAPVSFPPSPAYSSSPASVAYPAFNSPSSFTSSPAPLVRSAAAFGPPVYTHSPATHAAPSVNVTARYRLAPTPAPTAAGAASFTPEAPAISALSLAPIPSTLASSLAPTPSTFASSLAPTPAASTPSPAPVAEDAHELDPVEACFKCSICGQFIPGQRMGDFVRHEMTHVPKQDLDCGFPCYGVPNGDPAELAQMYPGLTSTRIKSGRMRPDVRVLDGMQMVGGCGQTFSRADALGRHLNRQDGSSSKGKRKQGGSQPSDAADAADATAAPDAAGEGEGQHDGLLCVGVPTANWNPGRREYLRRLAALKVRVRAARRRVQAAKHEDAKSRKRGRS